MLFEVKNFKIFSDCNNRWTFNPAALCKINTFSIGDVVCVLNDQAKVRELQKGHGEWIDVMKNVSFNIILLDKFLNVIRHC